MSDYFEIDFLDVESKKSGDAITIRYEQDGATRIHVVDGGYQATGESVVAHINKHYGNPKRIDHVVVTHHDGDHSGGLRTVLSSFEVGTLWMLRPWTYVEEIIHRFKRYKSTDNLASALREAFPNLAALEEIAEDQGIQIAEPFQGTSIGAFTVLAPSRERYLDLVVDSERTPDVVDEAGRLLARAGALIGEAVTNVLRLAHADWGVEVFSEEPISTENRMSLVQFANIAGKRILLTGDAGVDGLNEAADFAPVIGLALPGIDRFQVPHHGSRRNVSTAVLDRWLGSRLPEQVPEGSERFTAIISSAKADPNHPRNSVVRAMIHRGAHTIATESTSIRVSKDAPDREGWGPVTPLAYPWEQEAE